MTEQYIVERVDPWNAPATSEEKDMSGPAVDSEPPTDDVPAEAAPINETPETPMGWAPAAAAPVGEPTVHENPTAEITPYDAPAGEPVGDESGVKETIPYVAPTSETITNAAPVATTAGSSGALLGSEEAVRLRGRWSEIQGTFVDDPRTAVQQADALVSEVVDELTKTFATEHSSLETQWKQGNDVSTEDLRKALQHYRAFFNRLVA